MENNLEIKQGEISQSAIEEEMFDNNQLELDLSNDEYEFEHDDNHINEQSSFFKKLREKKLTA